MATILVADDEPSVRQLLVRVLQRCDHSVLEASNGLEAVAVFRSFSRYIDLVVIDMIMPVMDGAQALVRIRETRPSVPVICMSGFSPSVIPQGGRFLAKPFTPKALQQLVDEMLA